MTEYLLDFIDEMRTWQDFNIYLLIYLKDGKKHTIPSLAFWGSLFFYVNILESQGRKLCFSDGTIITGSGCVLELEECWIEEKQLERIDKFMRCLVR